MKDKGKDNFVKCFICLKLCNYHVFYYLFMEALAYLSDISLQVTNSVLALTHKQILPLCVT